MRGCQRSVCFCMSCVLNLYTHVAACMQDEVRSKLAQGGYTGAREKLVILISNEELESMGIQPRVVRLALLKAFSEGGWRHCRHKSQAYVTKHC